MTSNLRRIFLAFAVAGALVYLHSAVEGKEPKVIKTLSGDTEPDEAATQVSVGAAINASLTAAQQKAKEPKVIKTLSEFDQDKEVAPDTSVATEPETSTPVQSGSVTTAQPSQTNPPQTTANNAVEPQQVSNPPPTSPSAVKNAADEFSARYKVLRSK